MLTVHHRPYAQEDFMGVLVYSHNSTLGRWRQRWRQVIHTQIHSKFKGNLDYMKPYFKKRGKENYHVSSTM